MVRDGLSVILLHTQGRHFAVEVGQVEALRRKETVFPAREGPPDLLGFLPLGETRIPILDLGMRLGVPASGVRHVGLLVIPPARVAPLSFRVDRIEGPLMLGWDQMALLPALLRELQPRPITWAMVWQDERVVPILDLGQVVSPEETTTLTELAQGLD